MSDKRDKVAAHRESEEGHDARVNDALIAVVFVGHAPSPTSRLAPARHYYP